MDNPPTTNIHTIVKAQIVFLLSTLTEENFERNQMEIRSLAEQHGIDTYLHFIRRLIVHSQARLTAPPTASFDASTALTFRLLVQETQRLARDPFLAERFRDGVGGGEGDIFRHFDLLRFVDRVGLRALERFILASAILGGRTRPELTTQALNVIQLEFDNAAMSLTRPTSFDGADLALNQFAKILSSLLVDAPPEPSVLNAVQKQTLILAAQSKYGKEALSPVLAHIFATLSIPPSATLVQTLVQFGPEVTSDAEVVHALFERFGIVDSNPPRDVLAVEIISTLAKLAADGSVLCDVPVLVRVLGSYPTTLNWHAAIKSSFDRPDRSTVDTATLKLLIAILLNAPREAEPHAVAGFWEQWSNPLYQLRLLDALLSLPPDTFNFVQLPGKRIVTVDDVSIASPTIKSLAANVQGHTWNSLELFQILVKMADSESAEVRNCVKEMLDKAIKISAELVHMGLLQVPDASWNEIRLEYSRKLLAMFLAGHPNHQLVFMRIWQIQPSYLTTAFRDFYDENNLNITRILDVAQDLKILEPLLEVQPFTFALDIAALASRREYLNLDKWLADKVTAHGTDFLQAVIAFLQQKMESEKTSRLSDVESRTMALSPNTITIILRLLRNNSSNMPEADVHASIEVRNTCLQIHPRLMSLAPKSEVEPGLTVIQYSQEIESEVDNIYKQMYDSEITIDNVVNTLKRYKESGSPHEHEVFSCMIHFLFDEYKFFQSYYPARELQMTAYLFGSLIRFKLIDSIPLGIAIRYIIDALKCPPESNLFRFGMEALSRFEFRLGEWRPLCAALIEIPALAETRPDLITNIHRILATDGPTDDGFVPNGVGPPELPFIPFTSIQPDAMDENIEPPPEDISDRILFIVNNLAPSNFQAKVSEMREHFADQYARWFANYLVDQRVATEPNNHPLYLRFLDALDRQPLNKYILQETYVKAANLLNSERTVQSASDRTTLKNVGSWLGTLTLARDRPIKYKNLSFKELLVEGFETGRLIIAIPFVCKTLEPCSKSRVFKPPNPWLMAVIGVLAELYHFADLKLNLKFEIEVLCKALEIDLNTVEPGSILRNRPAESGAVDGPEFPGGGEVLQLDSAAAQGLATSIEPLLLALINAVQISPQLSPLNTNPVFKRAVQLAVDRAVREIIVPVVERSVTIAGISTGELVIKDFATEVNENKLRRAGYLMAQKLAGSLALVTCKEPLKTNLGNHLRQHLNEHGFTDQHVPDAVVQILVQDNLDTACATIEKAAMDRVIVDIDESFAASYEARRRHREARPGALFWDPAAPRSTFPAALPDPLRIKPNGLQTHQLGVYEDFVADTKHFPVVASRPASAASFGAAPPYIRSPSLDAQMHRGGGISHQDAMDRFTVITRDLEAVLVQIPAQSLASLPPNHDLRVLFQRILLLAEDAADRNRTPLMISQKVVQLLYKTPTQLGREIYAAILHQLCELFEDVEKEAIEWLLYAEDERKYNIPVTITLLRSGVIDYALHDQALAKSLFTGPRPALLSYVVGLIHESLTGNPPALSQVNFQYTLEVMRQFTQMGKATEEMTRLLDDLRDGGRRSADIAARPPMKPETEQMREKLHMWFQNWVTVFQRTATPEKSFVPFITNLTKNGILKAEDVSSFFFRVCTEASVSAYLKCVAIGEFDFAFQALDAFSRLIVYIIKYHGDAAGVNNEQAKVHYFTKILSIFVLVLANTHEEQGPEFQPKPFFRFFSSLLNDLHSMESALGPAYFQLLIAMSDTFSSLQPTYFPGFAFSWIALVSHRLFMPKLLLQENREGWSAYHKLLLSLFKFLNPFLRDGDLRAAERDLYCGVLRLLLVLLHDFPDFLSEYYFTLCDAIPPRCIQLRNIILSAFPATITLPDPHLNNVALDSVEMGPIPPILSDFTLVLRNGDLRVQLDQYLLGRGSPSFLAQLSQTVKASPDPTLEYNLSLINAIVMYIGVSSVAQAKARSGSSLFVPTDPGVIALQHLASNFETEGQHHLLSSMVLHLRYPNAHTHWFSSLILHLFMEVKNDKFKECVAKVLLERFIVHRPHPWGALVTFIELLRNPKYDFWTKEFIRAHPDVTQLLENVGRNL